MTNKDWEEEFSYKFGMKGPDGNSDSIGRKAGCDDCPVNVEWREEVKSFIQKHIDIAYEAGKKEGQHAGWVEAGGLIDRIGIVKQAFEKGKKAGREELTDNVKEV